MVVTRHPPFLPMMPDSQRSSKMHAPGAVRIRRSAAAWTDHLLSSTAVSAHAFMVRSVVTITGANRRTLEQPEPGVPVWRTSAGRAYTTTPTVYPA
jgi:hypothetical protein